MSDNNLLAHFDDPGSKKKVEVVQNEFMIVDTSSITALNISADESLDDTFSHSTREENNQSVFVASNEKAARSAQRIIVEDGNMDRRNEAVQNVDQQIENENEDPRGFLSSNTEHVKDDAENPKLIADNLQAAEGECDLQVGPGDHVDEVVSAEEPSSLYRNESESSVFEDEKTKIERHQAKKKGERKKGVKYVLDIKFDSVEDFDSSELANNIKASFNINSSKKVKNGIVKMYWCKFSRMKGFNCPVVKKDVFSSIGTVEVFRN